MDFSDYIDEKIQLDLKRSRAETSVQVQKAWQEKIKTAGFIVVFLILLVVLLALVGIMSINEDIRKIISPDVFAK